MSKLRSVIAVLVMLLGLTLPAAAQKVGEQYYLDSPGLDILGHPALGDSAVSVRFLHRSVARIMAVDTTADWLLVEVGGQSGWIAKRYLGQRILIEGMSRAARPADTGFAGTATVPQSAARTSKVEAADLKTHEELERRTGDGANVPKDMPTAARGELPPRPDTPYTVQTVFYATDRDIAGNVIPCDSPAVGSCFKDPDKAFGTGRGEVSYGVCQVSIPKDHRLGELESRSRWSALVLKFGEDPKKHVVLLRTSLLDHSGFLSELSGRVAASAAKRAFVFVHGYNVSFENAARRTAQMAYDLQFDGAAILYSWPSRDKWIDYSMDETDAEWAIPHLEEFLKDLAVGSSAQEIILIGHSMGCRALSRAFDALVADSAGVATKFREIVLTAPDIDAEVFKRDIAPRMVATGAQVTLYVSSRDKALTASKKYHGYSRAGDAGPDLVVMPGVETIDATAVDSGFFGHSYYGEVRSVLADLYYLIKDGKRAAQRFSLQPVAAAAGQYWEFKK